MRASHINFKGEIPKIYKGKYAGGSFWLSFLTEQIATFLLLFPWTPISAIVEAMKPYGCIAIWSYYSHMAIQPSGFMAKRVAIQENHHSSIGGGMVYQKRK